MFEQVMDQLKSAMVKVVEAMNAFIQKIRDLAEYLQGFVPSIPSEDEATTNA